MIDYHKGSDGIVLLTLDMPGRSTNVWNESSLSAFSSTLDRLASDEGIRGVIITSGKKTFLAGADLEVIERMATGGNSTAEMQNSAGELGRLLRRLETLGLPVVAAINGTALGGGYELCLACHRRISTDNPKVQVGLPEASLGLLPGAGGTQRLPRLIGVQASLGLLLEGKRLRPDRARE